MRDLKGLSYWIAGAFALAAALFHLWTAGFASTSRGAALAAPPDAAPARVPAVSSPPRLAARPAIRAGLDPGHPGRPAHLYSYHCANGGVFCAAAINMRFENVDPLSALELGLASS
jgi:hypothetical protein